MSENVKSLPNVLLTMLDRRPEILRFFKDEYVKTKEALSVGKIRKKFELSNKGFYKLFPNGVMELCEQANVPVPKDRYERVEKASAAKRAIKKESACLIEGDREFLELKQKESTFKAHAEDIKKKAEIRNSIKQIAMTLSRSPEGRGKIFSDPKLFQEYCEILLPSTLKQLKTFYSSRRQVFEKTLFSMQRLCSLNYQIWGHEPLNEYISEIISDHIKDNQKEERQEALQKKFEDILLKAQCPTCGSPLAQTFKYGKITQKTLLITEGLLSCQACEARLEVLCPGCKGRLGYKGEYEFYCSKCAFTFTMPHPEGKNIDTGIKMRIIYPHNIE